MPRTLTAAAAAVRLTAPAVLAQNPQGQNPQGQGNQGQGNQGQGSQGQYGQGRSAQQAAQKYLKSNDANGDGSLTRDELPADHRDNSQRLDQNKDNKLTAQELQQHADRMARTARPIEVLSIYVVEAANDVPSLGEVQKVYDMLRTADADHDGRITREEAMAARDRAIDQRINAAFEHCDKNNDGRISRDEAQGSLEQQFTRVDQNNDGAVTKDELKQCCKKDATQADQAAQGNQGNQGNQGGQQNN